MHLASFKNISLKTKVALAVAALFILFVSTVSYFTLSYFERKFKESISTQQFSLVSSLAATIDDKLSIAQNALNAVAANAPPEAITNADKAQRFLDDNVGLLSIFDNGIFFISEKGKLIAESPYRPGRRGRDLWFREWVQKTVSSEKPYISDPYISTHSPGQPAVVITVPIFDRQGNMTGMMTGSLDLTKKNILADLSGFKIGKAGYIFIIGSNRLLIVHPDKNRIMKPTAPSGVNKLVDQAFKGFEGSGETTTSYGVPMLLSVKHLSMTSWILGANYPISEAYAPLYTAEHYFIFATVGGTVLLLGATWLIMKRLMSPLTAVNRHLKQLPEKTGEKRLLKIEASDEIGMLATTFNNMVIDLDKQQEALAAKQHQLEALNCSLEERIIISVNELRQKDQMLIQQNRQAAMGEMINNIAHQWRQPLNNLGLIIQSLLEDFVMGELSEAGMRASIGKSMDTIMFMSRTIDDFSNFFRQDKRIKRFKVDDMVSQTLDFISANLKNSHIRVELESSEVVTALGYPNEFSQVLLNIINNARDVLIERRVSRPRIGITAFSENGHAVVKVRDNGGGIAEDILPRIFDPYFSTKEQGKGSGIGLYMSKSIIEQHMGGNLSVCNVEGGAEFRVEIRAE